jgi:hypothetical protein
MTCGSGGGSRGEEEYQRPEISGSGAGRSYHAVCHFPEQSPEAGPVISGAAQRGDIRKAAVIGIGEPVEHINLRLSGKHNKGNNHGLHGIEIFGDSVNHHPESPVQGISVTALHGIGGVDKQK